MKINLAKSAGFCFGVKRAIETAFNMIQSGQNVYMLGDIVHNEDVVKKIEAAGIKKIKKLTPVTNKTLLIRAHGISLNTIKKAHLLGYKVIDATCPMVKEIHKIAAEMEKKGYKIIIIGDKNHDEVLGIIGQLQHKALVIDSTTPLPIKNIKKIEKAAIVVQSTQNVEKTLKTLEVLKQNIKDLEFFNTICKPTRMKQQDLRKMPLVNDVMIIIGSKTSANTRRLYEISKSLNEHSFWVQSQDDLKKEWFKNSKNVGVTAGASTPDETTQSIIQHIKKIT